MGKRLTEKPITDERVVRCCNECLAVFQELGIKLPPKVKFTQKNTLAWFGLATYASSKVTLSESILNDPETELKKTILHELGHLAANLIEPGCGHRGEWKRIVRKVSLHTHIEITRTTNKSSGAHAEWFAAKHKKFTNTYTFVCPCCGSRVVRHKQTRFVKEYNKLSSSGEPMWWCAHCVKTTGKRIAFVKEE